MRGISRMDKNNLTAEQWQGIATRLASYLHSACHYQSECVYCTLNCPRSQMKEIGKIAATSETWIMKAKQELGYE